MEAGLTCFYYVFPPERFLVVLVREDEPADLLHQLGTLLRAGSESSQPQIVLAIFSHHPAHIISQFALLALLGARTSLITVPFVVRVVVLNRAPLALGLRLRLRLRMTGFLPLSLCLLG